MNIKIYKTKEKHLDFYYLWVNKKDSIEHKLHTTSKIEYKEHSEWFMQRIQDVNTKMWVIKEGKNFIGQIRLQKSTSIYYDIDIYIVKKYRGNNSASNALEAVLNIFLIRPIRAIVKKNNIISYNFFKKNSFFLNDEDINNWILTRK